MEKVSFAADNFLIAGNYWRSSNGKAVILAHMMPATKESFTPLAEKLAERGFGVLAIDLRGHGDSREKIYDGTTIPVSYHEFEEKDHVKSLEDLFAARDFLGEQGISADDIGVGGASIGANFAIQYLADNPTCPYAFALSPGFNYHGAETLSYVRRTQPSQFLHLIAAKNDESTPKTVFETEEIFTQTKADKKITLYEEGGHGTDIFNIHPECLEEIVTLVSAKV
ncbi:MAG: alpha/beta fold hydrolase, partial [Candidatus Pacebacteria bacterium]|nr:alpha/beta fold hydrolase [Candidatus Paceibacterota bacterium]